MIRTTILVLLSTYIQIYELHNFIKITLEIYSVLMRNNNGIIPYINKLNQKKIDESKEKSLLLLKFSVIDTMIRSIIKNVKTHRIINTQGTDTNVYCNSFAFYIATIVEVKGITDMHTHYRSISYVWFKILCSAQLCQVKLGYVQLGLGYDKLKLKRRGLIHSTQLMYCGLIRGWSQRGEDAFNAPRSKDIYSVSPGSEFQSGVESSPG